ncbi:flavin reductase [Micromonospora sp. NBC_01796]|uniref:flavin reductase n=1 Tax=Micromonospora sp. NBC_01796 TaxID=2975987 RepID=UPI003FA3B8F9
MTARTRTRRRPHLPMRPTWRCRVCAADWPCGPARLALLAEFHRNRVALCLYLSAQYVRALEDLAEYAPNAPRENLYNRFIAWPPVPRR